MAAVTRVDPQAQEAPAAAVVALEGPTTRTASRAATDSPAAAGAAQTTSRITGRVAATAPLSPEFLAPPWGPAAVAGTSLWERPGARLAAEEALQTRTQAAVAAAERDGTSALEAPEVTGPMIPTGMAVSGEGEEARAALPRAEGQEAAMARMAAAAPQWGMAAPREVSMDLPILSCWVAAQAAAAVARRGAGPARAA